MCSFFKICERKPRKGYDPHKLHVVWIPKGKYANRNFQYGRYSRNDVMKLNLYVSCSHHYCADPNNIIFQVCKKAHSWGVLKKLAHNYIKIYSQFRWGKYTSASEFRILLGGQNLAHRLILSAKMENFRKISIKK